MTETDPALLIADDDQRGETEPPSALDHLRYAIDVDEPIDEFAVAVLASVVIAAAAAAFTFTCHKLSASLARRSRTEPPLAWFV
jgi:hypothetical protein